MYQLVKFEVLEKWWNVYAPNLSLRMYKFYLSKSTAELYPRAWASKFIYPFFSIEEAEHFVWTQAQAQAGSSPDSKDSQKLRQSKTGSNPYPIRMKWRCGMNAFRWTIAGHLLLFLQKILVAASPLKSLLHLSLSPFSSCLHLNLGYISARWCYWYRIRAFFPGH